MQEHRVPSKNMQILVVDDEPDIRELLDMTLARMGLACQCAGSVAEARRLLEQHHFRLCLTDMRLPDGEGLELVRHIATHYHDVPVAVITAYGNMDNAVQALKSGAFDYLAKPVSLEQLRTLVKSAIALPQPDHKHVQGNEPILFGDSPAIQQIRALIERVARSQAPVYISGESGSGKELAARLIHQRGARHDHPFIAVNCGAIPESLMESEFFGYRKGAFTGADQDRSGFFQAADSGTLFLDEVADLPLSMQVKLLRAIQEKRVRKVGATSEEPVDVRLICATHQDLKAMVEQGRFRQDLFYRLNVIGLRMPALRECRDDIAQLAEHLLKRLAIEAGVSKPRFSPSALQALFAHSFPGNVRELENTLERALALLNGDVIEAADLHLMIEEPAMQKDIRQPDAMASTSLHEQLDRTERQAIQDALQKAQFNHAMAAQLLGVTARSLHYRMDRLRMRA